MVTNRITKEEVLNVLDYDQENGCFYWKKPYKSKKTSGLAGYKHPSGYRYIRIGNYRYLEHRLVWLVETGSFPIFDIDHIDRNRSNNNFCNLRLATDSVNQQNTDAKLNNTSGFKGVSWNRANRKFKAQITVNRKKIYLGYFDVAENAHNAYKAASIEFHPFSIYRANNG